MPTATQCIFLLNERFFMSGKAILVILAQRSTGYRPERPVRPPNVMQQGVQGIRCHRD